MPENRSPNSNSRSSKSSRSSRGNKSRNKNKDAKKSKGLLSGGQGSDSSDKPTKSERETKQHSTHTQEKINANIETSAKGANNFVPDVGDVFKAPSPERRPDQRRQQAEAASQNRAAQKQAQLIDKQLRDPNRTGDVTHLAAQQMAAREAAAKVETERFSRARANAAQSRAMNGREAIRKKSEARKQYANSMRVNGTVQNLSGIVTPKFHLPAGVRPENAMDVFDFSSNLNNLLMPKHKIADYLIRETAIGNAKQAREKLTALNNRLLPRSGKQWQDMNYRTRIYKHKDVQDAHRDLSMTVDPHEWNRSKFLPLAAHEKHGLNFALPTVVEGVLDAVMLPGDVLQGKHTAPTAKRMDGAGNLFDNSNQFVGNKNQMYTALVDGGIGVATNFAGGKIATASARPTIQMGKNTANFVKAGREIKIGKNLRFAPVGNRTGHKYGELPHYHRRGALDPETGFTRAGQGISRHRPYENSIHDRSIWDRF